MAKRKSHTANPTAMGKPDRAWEARDAMHTLRRAEEIKSDPKLHAAAKAHAKTEAHALRKIAGRSKA